MAISIGTVTMKDTMVMAAATQRQKTRSRHPATWAKKGTCRRKMRLSSNK